MDSRKSAFVTTGILLAVVILFIPVVVLAAGEQWLTGFYALAAAAIIFFVPYFSFKWWYVPRPSNELLDRIEAFHKKYGHSPFDARYGPMP